MLDLRYPAAFVRFRTPLLLAAGVLRALARAYPGCAYAADLRLGLLDFLLFPAQNLMGKTPESREDLRRRLEDAAREVTDRDAATAWARTDTLLVLAAHAARKGNAKEQRAFTERFITLCPDDLRIPGLKQALGGK